MVSDNAFTFPRWWIILIIVGVAVLNAVLGLLGWTVVG